MSLSFHPLLVRCSQIHQGWAHDSIVTHADVKNASFGGLLGTAASVKGVRGVIVDGRCRDLAELRALNLKVSPPSIACSVSS